MFKWLRQSRLRMASSGLFILGGLAGIVFWGGFNTAMEYTNTLEFCVSCHEMRDTVYVEYQQSVHFKNPSGVRAICSDCHVPKSWTAKLVRKIKATKELYHKVVGTIDTPEKFEANRLEMAERVWAEMKANDSRECRNCHDYHSMDFDNQSRRASEKMQPAMEEGKTCIECHKGIAHVNPEEDDDD